MSNRQLDEEAIFRIARKLADPNDRSMYLEQVCAGDAPLRDRVKALLEVHDRDQDFLQSNGDPGPTAEQPVIRETPGQEIGRYKLLQPIGEGGFGVVYMAEQRRPVHRKVARKIIKPGMDTHAVVARFEAERQALALMDHPNIARVFDGGTTETGRPYFVMELVRGVPITDYCDANQLPTEARLQLFIAVCHAIQHAHQKGIIHRDLKPSNILVTLHDGQPVVKVIDFGVAKAINQQLTEKTLFTSYGQMIGTPQYMSPEQAEMSGLDVDTRSDTYSLGVLLYELLTGTTPLEGERLRTVGYAEMQRLIREEDPPTPSSRLSTFGEKATIVAKHRSATPERLHRILRGGLDWIVMKALEKDRARRYESAIALGNDTQRYLDNEPTEAGPTSPVYRLRKFIRRYRAFVMLVSTVLLLLTAGALAALREWRNEIASSERLTTISDDLADGKQQLESLLGQYKELLTEAHITAAMSDDATQADMILQNAIDVGIPDTELRFLRALDAMIRGEWSTTVGWLAPHVEESRSVAELSLLAICQSYSGDSTAYANSLQRAKSLPVASDHDRVFLGWAETLSDYEETITLLTPVCRKRAAWVLPHTILAIAYMSKAIDMSDLDAAHASIASIDKSRQLLPHNQVTQGVSLMCANIHMLVSEQHGESPDIWKNRALAEIDSLSDDRPFHLVASFYQDIGDYALAAREWETWRLRYGVSRARVTAGDSGHGVAGDAYNFEYIAFLLRQGEVAKAQQFLDECDADLGPWTDVCRMILLALENKADNKHRIRALLDKWETRATMLDPFLLPHLIDLNLVINERDNAVQLAARVAGRDVHAIRGQSLASDLVSLTALSDAGARDRALTQIHSRIGPSRNQHSEFHYHTAFHFLAHGQRERAIESLEATHPKGPWGWGGDYFFAKTLAKKLRTDPTWPVWITVEVPSD